VEFTPSKLYLLNHHPSGVASQGSAHLQQRLLWSADTETDSSSCGDEGSNASGELDISADSMTGNLMEVLEEVGGIQESDNVDCRVAETAADGDQAQVTVAPMILPHNASAVTLQPSESRSSFTEDDTCSGRDSPDPELSVASEDSEQSGIAGCVIYPESPRATPQGTTPATLQAMSSGIPSRRRTHSVLIVVTTTVVMLLLSAFLPQMSMAVTSAATGYLQELHEDAPYHINLSHPHAQGGVQVLVTSGAVMEISVKEIVRELDEGPERDERDHTALFDDELSVASGVTLQAGNHIAPSQPQTLLVTARLAGRFQEGLRAFNRRFANLVEIVRREIGNFFTRFKWRK
jgi:hypothetical protein